MSRTRTDGSGGNRRGIRASFGSIRALPSGRYQARYTHPVTRAEIKAPTTFGTKAPAQAWLRREAVRLEAEAAGAPKAQVRPPAPTLREYAATWLADRPIRPTTRRGYTSYLDKHVLPSLGDMPLDAITADVIRAWHRRMAPGAPTARARTFAMTKTIFASAVDEGLIAENPCRVRGGTTARVSVEVFTATPEQVSTLAAAMPERLALAILLGAWCQLRAGETLALRRRDVDLDVGVVHVRRGVTWPGRDPVFGPPKTAAGIRTVHMPDVVVAAVREHLDRFVEGHAHALLFPASPGRPVHLSWLARKVKAAASVAGLPPTFRYHHLRHSGLTALAGLGASLAELQARAGHATPGIAMRYQHAVAERDRALADRLGTIAGTPGQPESRPASTDGPVRGTRWAPRRTLERP